MKLLEHSPHLKDEWDFEKNKDIDIEKISCFSHKRACWVCNKDSRHKWEAVIASRTKLSSGCPYCSKLRVLREDSLGTTHFYLLKEWNFDKNKIDPFTISQGSDRKVWWVCPKEHEWKTSIKHRALNGSNCPYCAGKKVGYGNSFADMMPLLLKEWNFDKNTISPYDITAGSHKKAWWICPQKHEWMSIIKDRSYRGYGCPKCSNRVSNTATKWLDSLGVMIREVSIKIKGRKRPFFVDGFDPKTNTIYEYFGYFWHGHPDYHSPNDINPISKKKFGTLYKKTLEKIEILEAAGYKVIYKWGK